MLGNRTISTLELVGVDLWGCGAVAAADLLNAMIGHPTLTSVNLGWNQAAQLDAQRQAAGSLLGALIAANAPALRQLCIDNSDLRNDGFRAVAAALPRNTHLSDFRCFGNALTPVFARDTLLPAVKANNSLLNLEAQGNFDFDDHGERLPVTPWLQQAEQVVNERSARASLYNSQ